MPTEPRSVTVLRVKRATGEMLRRPTPCATTVGDLLLAGVLALGALLQVLVFLPIAAPLVGAVIALGSTVPVAWRRTHPAVAALVGTLPWAIPAHGFVLVGYVAGVVLFYSLTAYCPDAYVAGGVVLIGCVLAVVGGAEQHVAIGEYFGGLLVVVAPAGVGLLVRSQRERTRQLEELTSLLERERDRRERAAVADERARIARELHDLVAHALTVVAVQADAAQAAIEKNPIQAHAPLATIRASAQQGLREMRRLLGVLRSDDGDADLAPLPGIAQLPVLIEQARTAGVTARLHLDQPNRDVSPSVDLTAYRIVQEALTNAGKHARGAAVEVDVRWLGDAFDIRVRDKGPGPNGAPAPDAHGLVGMRERVRIHGGTFEAGAVDGGGFCVHALLPAVDR